MECKKRNKQPENVSENVLNLHPEHTGTGIKPGGVQQVWKSPYIHKQNQKQTKLAN